MYTTDIKTIRVYLNERMIQKLESYLSIHEIIGEEIFSYLGVDHFPGSFTFKPVMKDVFIRRIPFYLFRPVLKSRYHGNLLQYINGIHQYMDTCIDAEIWIERLYESLEKLFYSYNVSLEQIFDYPIEQTGQGDRVDNLINWVHYLDLTEQSGLANKTPDRFIIEYNYTLEKNGLPPIIYYHDLGSEIRNNNVIVLKGTFPSDEDGNPILRWINLGIYNPKKVWTELNEHFQGSLYIEIQPTTAILFRFTQNDDDDWDTIYAGTQLMHFSPKALKFHRMIRKYSQKYIADAIGATVRTYQKWESGDTTPDGHHLLRIMNVLDIRDPKDLTIWVMTDDSQQALGSLKGEQQR